MLLCVCVSTSEYVTVSLCVCVSLCMCLGCRFSAFPGEAKSDKQDLSHLWCLRFDSTTESNVCLITTNTGTTTQIHPYAVKWTPKIQHWFKSEGFPLYFPCISL